MSDTTRDSENRGDNAALQAKVALLQEKIDAALKKTLINMRENRKRASFVKLTVTACSAFATIFLGLKSPNLESQFKDAAFVLTALVTLLNALEPFFN